MTSKKLLLLPLALPAIGPLHAANVNAVTNNGDWEAAGTWSDNAAPAAANDYFVPNGIAIDGYTGANVTTAVARDFAGNSLTIQEGGSLYLDGGHNSSYPDWTYNISRLTLENGGNLHFRGGAGTDFFLTNGFAVGGTNSTVSIRHSAGSYDQRARLGPITGPAGSTIQILATHDPSSGGTYAKDNYATSADSTYAGNWFLDFTIDNSSRNIRLRADAANALGTGTVTLGRRAVLENTVTGGFDSLSGIVLQEPTSVLNFGPGWTSATGTVSANFGTVNLGSATTYGTASFATLEHSGSLVQFDVGATPAKADKIVVNSYVAGESSPIDVRLTELPGNGTYELVSYGTLTGSLDAQLLTRTRLVPNFSYGDGSNDKVTVSFTGNTANLVWKGNDEINPNSWDLDTTANFDNAGTPDTFLFGDSVLFDDTASSFAPAITGTLTPRVVTFNNSTNAYTLSGAGAIALNTSLVKSGSNSLTISNANTFTGSVSVNGGSLLIGNASALGAAGSKEVTVNGGTLDFNGISPGTTRAYNYSIAGNGNGTGALVNSHATASVGANSGIANLTLTDDATIGGTSRFDIGRIGSVSGVTTGNNHTLTKTGTNQIQLRGDASGSPIHIVVNGGALGAEDSDTAFGGSDSSVTVNDGARLGTYGPRTIPAPVTLNAGGTIYNQGNAASTWTGLVTFAGNSTIDTGGQSITVGATAGAGTLTKAGNNTLTMSAARSGSGATELKQGNLRATANEAFGSGIVTVAGTSNTTQTRVELQGATVSNDFVLNSIGTTGYAGAITATGGVTSIINGDITVSSGVGNGGHLATTGTGTLLRLNGALIAEGTAIPNIRAGTVEIGGGGSYPRLDQGEGTLRLVADNGINPLAELRLAVSAAGTLDLNGYNQTLAQLLRAPVTSPKAATVTNTAATPSVLTIDGSVDHAYEGALNNGSGGISLVKSGTSTFTLAAISTYEGSTTVNGGKLLINASHGIADSSPVIVNAGGTLGGVGPVNGDVSISGALAPGNGAGNLLTNGSVVFGPGSRYEWEVGNWTGTQAGADWDLVDSIDLALTATPAQKLTIAVSGSAANFSESAKSFEIARSTTPITGFDAAAIEIDDSAFFGTGTWSAQVSGNSLVLVYAAGSGTPYSNWATANGIAGATANQDSDGDGIPNGIEFVIGGDPSGPDSSSLHLLPVITSDATYLNFTFRRTDESAGSNPLVQYSTDLGDTWLEAQSGEEGVIVEETNTGTGVDTVTVKIPRALAEGGKLFARLHVEVE